jgi:predicted O-methyltransferase YrrM
LREHCYAHYDDKAMLSGFVQGRVLSMFSRMIRPRVVLEIGTYLGYSALCFAEGLVEGGKVITLDVNEETNKVARSFVEKSEYKDQIEFHLGSGVDVIPSLPETFDLVFIDADKPNYANYYNLVFDKVAPAASSSPTMFCGAGRFSRPMMRTRRLSTISI